MNCALAQLKHRPESMGSVWREQNDGHSRLAEFLDYVRTVLGGTGSPPSRADRKSVV